LGDEEKADYFAKDYNIFKRTTDNTLWKFDTFYHNDGIRVKAKKINTYKEVEE